SAREDGRAEGRLAGRKGIPDANPEDECGDRSGGAPRVDLSATRTERAASPWSDRRASRGGPAAGPPRRAGRARRRPPGRGGGNRRRQAGKEAEKPYQRPHTSKGASDWPIGSTWPRPCESWSTTIAVPPSSSTKGLSRLASSLAG